MKTGNIPGTTKIRPVLDVFVSEHQDLKCIHIEVSSRLHGTAWIRKNRGVTRARRSSEFAPEIEGTHTVKNRWRNRSQAQAEHPGPCIGRPIAFHPEITPTPPPDRLYQASRIPPS